MKYFKVNYTIYNVNGTIRKQGSICKLKFDTIKRIAYLKSLYGMLVEFDNNKNTYFTDHTVNEFSNADSFIRFWNHFHYKTCQKKLNKAISQRLWDKTINLSLKRQAFDNITKDIKVDAYTYLLKELRNY